jgi:hypothetical protein
MSQLSSMNLTVELLRRARRPKGGEENSTLKSTISTLYRSRVDVNEARRVIVLFVIIHIMNESRKHREMTRVKSRRPRLAKEK